MKDADWIKTQPEYIKGRAKSAKKSKQLKKSKSKSK